MSLAPQAILSQNNKVLSTGVGQEVALMSIARGRYYSLDPIASQIWARLAQPIRVDALTQATVRDYAGDPVRIQSDLNELLTKLLEEGLVEVVAPGRA